MKLIGPSVRRPLSSSLAKFSSSVSICAALAIAAGTSARATSFQWDPDGNAGNATFGGSGDWNTTSTFWFDGTNDVVWPNTAVNADTAVFGGTAGTVALKVPIFANALQFDSDAYTLTNGGSAANTLTLSGTTPSVTVTTSGQTATISTIVAGSTDWSKAGNGTLLLSGANTFTGALTVTSGTLKVGNVAALGTNTAGTTISSGATLDVNGTALGTETVTVSGSGVGGNGAIINSSATGQNNALQSVVLTGDTVFGGTSRWDIRNLNSVGSLSTGGQGYKITKIGANQVNLVGLTIDSALGDIDINAGIFGFETTSTLGDASKTITVADGATLQFYNSSQALNKKIVLNGSTATGAKIQQANSNTTLSGPVTLGGTGGNTIDITGTTLTINGVVDGTANLTKTGVGALILGNAANTYTGNTTISGGVIKYNSAGAIGGTGANITVNSGAVAAAGYAIDQGFLGRIVSTSAGSVALGGVDSSNNLDFSSAGANLIAASLGAYGNATYTGTLTPNGTTYRLGGGGGTLTLSNANALTGANDLVVTGSTVNLSNSNNYTGTTTVSGGTLIVSAANATSTGAVTIASGATLQVGNAGTTGSLGNSTVAITGTLSFNHSDNTTLSTPLTGTGSVNQASTSTLNLAVASVPRLTFNNSGKVDLQGNTVTIGVDGGNSFQMNAAGYASVLATGGGSVKLGGNASDFGATTNAILAISAPLTNGAGTALDIYNPSTTPGIVILTGANTYTGATNIQSGTLVASSLNRVSGGTASSSLGAPTTAAAGTIGIASSNPSGLRYIGAGETTDRVINLAGVAAGATLDQSGTGVLGFSSNFTATGGGSKTLTLQGSTSGSGLITGLIVNNSSTNKTSLVKTGSGLWTLTGANDSGNILGYTGSTSVNGGTLKLDFGNSTLTSNIINTASALQLGGGSLAVNGKTNTTNSQTFASTTLNAGGSSVVLTNDPTSNSLVVSLGAITRNAGATVDFTNPANGTISATNGITTTALNNSAGILGGYATVGGTDWATVSGGNIVALPAASYTAAPTSGGSNTTNYLLNGALTLTGAATFNSLKITDSAASQVLALGTNPLTLSGTSGGLLYAGGTSNAYTISGTGAGTIGAGSANEFIVNTAAGALTISAPISATGLTKTGAGTLTLSGANTFTGNININGGVLAIAGPGGTTDPTTLGATGSRLITLNGGTFRVTGSVYNPNQNTKNFVITGTGGTFDIASGATLTLDDGNASVGSGTTTGAPQLQGTSTLTKAGTGTLQLGYSGQSGQQTGGGGTGFLGFTGNIVIAAGTVQAGNANALGSSAGNTTVLSGGTLDFYSSAFANFEGITLSGNGNSTSSGGALINSSANAITLNGPISLASASTIGGNGAGGLTLNGPITNSVNTSTLTKSGTGKVTVGGPVSLVSGSTLNVTGGTLAVAVSGSISGTTSIAVANGATLTNNGTVNGNLDVSGILGGSGSVAGTVTVESGGTVAPGNSAGTLSLTSDLTLNTGSHLALEIGTTAVGGSDLVAVGGGTVTLGGSLDVTLLPTFANQVGDTFTLVLNGGSAAVASTFSNVTPIDATTGTLTLGDGHVFLVNYAANLDAGAIGNDVTAQLVAVPEPSALVALLGGTAALLGLSRGRSRTKRR